MNIIGNEIEIRVIDEKHLGDQENGRMSTKTSFSYSSNQGGKIWHPNCVRLAPNETNLGLFKISFSTFWLSEPKCTETDLKKSQICLIWGQSEPI